MIATDLITSAWFAGQPWALRRLSGVTLAAAVAASATWFGYDSPALAQRAYQALATHDLPRPVETILVLGGGGSHRIRRALELEREGFADRIVVFGTAAEMQCAFLVAREVRRQEGGDSVHPGLEYGPSGIRDTEDAVEAMGAWLRAEGIRHGLVVSDDHHLRRVRVLLQAGGFGDLRLGMISSGRPAPDLGTAGGRWAVLRELVAIPFEGTRALTRRGVRGLSRCLLEPVQATVDALGLQSRPLLLSERFPGR